MSLKTALERLYRYSHRKEGTFAAIYWIAFFLIYYGLFFGSLKERASEATGSFEPGFILLVAAFGLITIFGFGFYYWLSLTNPYRERPSREQRFDAIAAFVYVGFCLIVLLVGFVFLVAGPGSGT